MEALAISKLHILKLMYLHVQTILQRILKLIAKTKKSLMISLGILMLNYCFLMLILIHRNWDQKEEFLITLIHACFKS